MGFSLGKTISACLCVTVCLICSCEKHAAGEYPEVQRDRTEITQQPAEAADIVPDSPAPAAKTTPAQFFPTPR